MHVSLRDFFNGFWVHPARIGGWFCSWQRALYLKVKKPLSPKKEKNPKRICVWLIWVVWWTRAVTITLKKKNKKKKKGSLKCFVYSHKAASTMPAQLSDWREQPSDSVELHLLVSFLFLDLMSSTGLFIQGLCSTKEYCVLRRFLILTAALSSAVAESGPWRTWALCGLPAKAVAPTILIRQDDGRQALEICALPVSAEGARTKWSPLYFFFKCEPLTEAPSAVFPFCSRVIKGSSLVPWWADLYLQWISLETVIILAFKKIFQNTSAH